MTQDWYGSFDYRYRLTISSNLNYHTGTRLILLVILSNIGYRLTITGNLNYHTGTRLILLAILSIILNY